MLYSLISSHAAQRPTAGTQPLCADPGKPGAPHLLPQAQAGQHSEELTTPRQLTASLLLTPQILSAAIPAPFLASLTKQLISTLSPRLQSFPRLCGIGLLHPSKRAALPETSHTVLLPCDCLFPRLPAAEAPHHLPKKHLPSSGLLATLSFELSQCIWFLHECLDIQSHLNLRRPPAPMPTLNLNMTLV